MAIDVTPGSPTAVAYISVAEADAYFAERGITDWTGDETAKEHAIVKGADYLEREYYGRWVGYRAKQEQSMSWPRTYVEDLDGYAIPADEIPRNVKWANAEAALLSLTGTNLEPVLERGGKYTSLKSKAGPVEEEIEYSGGASGRDTITSIDGLLRGLYYGSIVQPLLRA